MRKVTSVPLGDVNVMFGIAGVVEVPPLVHRIAVLTDCVVGSSQSQTPTVGVLVLKVKFTKLLNVTSKFLGPDGIWNRNIYPPELQPPALAASPDVAATSCAEQRTCSAIFKFLFGDEKKFVGPKRFQFSTLFSAPNPELCLVGGVARADIGYVARINAIKIATMQFLGFFKVAPFIKSLNVG
jgi:hypothetical protein